jgi:hypothetical protein
MFNNIDILLSLGTVCFLLAFSLLLAKGMQLLVKKIYGIQAQLNLFWELCIGLFLAISLYAIVITKGQTILLLAPLFVFLLIQKILIASPHLNDDNHLRKPYVFLLVSIVVQFAFFLYTLVSFNHEYVKFIAGDFNIYYRMAIRLNAFGVEAYNFNLDPQYFKTPGVYHYGDLWLYALVSKITQANPSIVFLTAFTCLSSVFTLGLLTYINDVFAPQLKQKQAYLYLLLVGGLFAGFQFCFPAFIRQYAEPYTLSIFNWGKVMVLSCSLIGMLLVVRTKNWYTAAIFSVIAGLYYINAVPALFGALFMLLLIAIIRKQISVKQYVQVNALYLLGLLLSLLLQYKIFPMLMGMNQEQSTNGASLNFLHRVSIADYVHTAFNIFIGGWFQLLTLLPYLLVLLLAYLLGQKHRMHWRELLNKMDYSLLFLLFVFASGLFSWALLYPLRVDTVQFFHNLVAPVYVVFIALVLFYVIACSRNQILVVLTVLLVMGSVIQSAQNVFYANIFNKSEWLSLQQFIGNETKSSPFVNIKPLKELSTAFNRKTDQYIPLNILVYKWPDYHNVSLNAALIQLDTMDLYYHEAKEDIRTSSFAMYTDRMQQLGLNNMDALTGSFIKDYHVRYLSVSLDTTLPFFIRKSVVDSLVLPNTNYTIYKLAQHDR